MEEFDIDSFISDDYQETNINESKIDDLDINYLNSFNLIMFSDGSCCGNGSKEINKAKGGFGIYIYNNNSESEYYTYNDTKIIKKIDKDVIFYKKDILDIIYYNYTHTNNSNILCKKDDCTNFGTYDIGFCKNHKKPKMTLSNYYFTYSPTNIRAEGFGILYSLMYIKLVSIDKIKNKKLIGQNMKLPIINNILNSLKVLNYNKESTNKFLIVSDSLFWIDLITKWLNSWINKKIVLEKKNVDIILYINYYMNLLIENNIQIVFKHIKGHSDTKLKNEDLNLYQRGNVMADKLANISHESNSLQIRIIY